MIIAHNQEAFEHLVEVTESMLAAGINNQADVFQAKLQLSKTQQQRIEFEQALALSQARLARWFGQASDVQLPDQLPEFAPLYDKSALQQNLLNHPRLKGDSALIEVEEQGVKYAREQYKPGVTAAFGYGFRQGRMSFGDLPGPRRPDMISFNLALDLPVFPGKRQSKTLAAAEQTRNAVEDARASTYRQITSDLNQQYVLWQNLDEQSQLYASNLIPESQQFAQSTLNAYESNLTDFNQVIAAYITSMNVELERLQIEVDKSKARVMLLYLES